MFWQGTFQGCEDFICKQKEFFFHILFIPSGTTKHFKKFMIVKIIILITIKYIMMTTNTTVQLMLLVTKLSSKYDSQIFITSNIPILMQHTPSQPRYILLLPFHIGLDIISLIICNFSPLSSYYYSWMKWYTTKMYEGIICQAPCILNLINR